MAGNKQIAEFYKTDNSEAPEGYYPVPKSSVRFSGERRNENICRRCDWRPYCSAAVCGCMSYNRKDNISVVFKVNIIKKEKTNDR